MMLSLLNRLFSLTPHRVVNEPVDPLSPSAASPFGRTPAPGSTVVMSTKSPATGPAAPLPFPLSPGFCPPPFCPPPFWPPPLPSGRPAPMPLHPANRPRPFGAVPPTRRMSVPIRSRAALRWDFSGPRIALRTKSGSPDCAWRVDASLAYASVICWSSRASSRSTPARAPRGTFRSLWPTSGHLIVAI
ncbi:hypothetical protein SFUMM280S_04684 [Streptomyces fumanus]